MEQGRAGAGLLRVLVLGGGVTACICLGGLWGGLPSLGDELEVPTGSAKTHPAEEGRSCASAGCHQELLGGRFVHSAAEECDSCHEKQGSSYVLAEGSIGALCASCHDRDEGEHVHGPYAAGLCTDCHDTHSSANADLLKAPPAQLCYLCHERGSVSGDGAAWQHGPFTVGACLVCHSPHASAHESFLRGEVNEVCLGCHEALGEALDEARHKHAPVLEDCTGCHDPHGGPTELFLREGGAPGLCLGCHDDVAEHLAEKGTREHGALERDRSCLACHSPHASADAPLLIDSPQGLCLGCHGESTGGLTAMGPLLESNPDHHGPIREGSCTGCHDPHASTHFRLLHLEYPGSFYAPFELSRFALCFECHEPERILEERTSTATRFRDGRRNLHYLHVNRARKGRTCRACHEVHASSHPFHIRESVPFGRSGWQLPTNFRKLDLGGSCAPGCHKPFTYTPSDGGE